MLHSNALSASPSPQAHYYAPAQWHDSLCTWDNFCEIAQLSDFQFDADWPEKTASKVICTPHRLSYMGLKLNNGPLFHAERLRPVPIWAKNRLYSGTRRRNPRTAGVWKISSSILLFFLHFTRFPYPSIHRVILLPGFFFFLPLRQLDSPREINTHFQFWYFQEAFPQDI